MKTILNDILKLVKLTAKYNYFSPLYYYLLTESVTGDIYNPSRNNSIDCRLQVNDKVIPGPDIAFTQYRRKSFFKL